MSEIEGDRVSELRAHCFIEEHGHNNQPLPGLDAMQGSRETEDESCQACEPAELYTCTGLLSAGRRRERTAADVTSAVQGELAVLDWKEKHQYNALVSITTKYSFVWEFDKAMSALAAIAISDFIAGQAPLEWSLCTNDMGPHHSASSGYWSFPHMAGPGANSSQPCSPRQ